MIKTFEDLKNKITKSRVDLNDVINHAYHLPEVTKDVLTTLICTKCHADTKDTFRRRLNSTNALPNYDIFRQVFIHSPEKVSFCAGGLYSEGIKTVRELILKG